MIRYSAISTYNRERNAGMKTPSAGKARSDNTNMNGMKCLIDIALGFSLIVLNRAFPFCAPYLNKPLTVSLQ